jgi:flavodoxin I
MYDVIYFSRAGSTRRLATAIADELGVKARHLRSVPSLPEAADVFLGSGLYFMRPPRLVREFIRNNDFRGRKIALFGTSSSGIGIEVLWMAWLLKRKGAIISGKYHCPGQFFLRCAGRFLYFRKGRPASRDLEKAKRFAGSLRGVPDEIMANAEGQNERHEDRILSSV